MANSIFNDSRPIGVFDSGIGGLTVLRALCSELPSERFLYLGDTARLPYGTKSRDTIRRYALLAAELLVAQGIKCLVVACNTVSSIALDELRRRFAPLPVVGVVDPGAAAGVQASRTGRIAVIATESTVQGGAYQRAIERLRPDARVVAKACPLFVALAEEGWTTGAEVLGVAHRYLDPLFQSKSTGELPDTLVLGCTHFPVLIDALRQVVGDSVAIVDSAVTTAKALRRVLHHEGLAQDAGRQQSALQWHLMATDGRERFARVGGLFLGESVAPEDVDLVDIVG